MGHCEIDQRANQSYNALFPTEGEWFCEDIRAADPAGLPDFDLLCGGFPCQSFPWLESVEASQTHEALCSLKLPGWLKPGTLRISYWRTYPACSAMTKAGHLRPSSIRWTDWGMVWNGRCLTARISASLNPAAGCTLSAILTPDAPEKYFLSPRQQAQLLCSFGAGSRENESTPPKE